jgi:hypothetical protein
MMSKEREAFEAWGKREHGWNQEALNALWDINRYRNGIFQLYWEAWQGRAKIAKEREGYYNG